MNREEIEAANARVVAAGGFVQPLLAETGKVIVGQHHLMERMVIGQYRPIYVLKTPIRFTPNTLVEVVQQ